ncbi:hypothetical protein F0U61_10195 [Archangium violaceum]|uniref:hypothetical protein n=1 Tax=Archangium violaceum TaxID=83451 RepID=UPI002B2B28CC|nr:hypothetical protein F0U61_10195 [Archangium violaceum]
MSWAVHLLALTLATAEVESEPPSNQTLVFYNARLALREERPEEVLKLWLLHNSLANLGERGSHDEEFRSVVWAALGNRGLCQDGFPKDAQGGAGLWPLALHNWVAQAMVKGPPPEIPAPFKAFEVGRQQRFISLQDVLSAPELRSVSFFRGSCLLPYLTMFESGQLPEFKPGHLLPRYDLDDRLSSGLLLRRLLKLSLQTLVREKVQSVAAVEARIFDLDLALVRLRARQARQQGATAEQRARNAGISSEGIREMREAAVAWPENSEQAAFLRRSLTWRADEWLTLNRQRRLFLFAQARPLARDAQALEQLELDIIDALIERKAGDELEAWIGHLDASETPSRRGALIAGERGKRLLELEPGTGFRERSVIALHRGVAFLESGQQQDALRSFAYAMATAEESRESEAIRALARRWLSYVLSRYETSEEVIATLKALVPRQEYNPVIEDLVWRAALRGDERSFERVVASARRGGAFDAHIARLRPLAQGKPGEMATQLRDAAAEEPYLTLRFVRQLLEHLEAEDADVRAANVPMLKLVIRVLDSFAAKTGGSNSHVRTAEELRARAQAILEGLSYLDTSSEGRARALSPHHEAFAGNIRLAPADPLPWPFRTPETEAPSAFTPLSLQPVEWRDAKGALVFGWRLTE